MSAGLLAVTLLGVFLLGFGVGLAVGAMWMGRGAR